MGFEPMNTGLLKMYNPTVDVQLDCETKAIDTMLNYDRPGSC